MNTGIIHNEPIGDYHGSDAVSSTRLMDMRPCPAYFHGRHIAKSIPGPKSDAFDLGNAAHWLILEGRGALESRTVLQPATYPSFSQHKIPLFLGDKPWNNAANFCKDWCANQGDLVVLSAEDFALVDKMAAAVGENPDAAALLSGGESEVTFRVQHPAFAVQCRADHWHDGTQTIVDLKTCETIERFKSEYFRLRYYMRAAFYREVVGIVIGVKHLATMPAFAFVAVEKSAPHRCEVFEPSEGDLELGRNEMLADLKTLRECIESGRWEGSKLGVQPIELTAWQRKIAEANAAGLFAEVEL